MMIQLCKKIQNSNEFVIFLNNFFINSRLFKVLKFINCETCETAKINCEYFLKLMKLRTAVIKKKIEKKMNVMIIKKNKKTNIEKKT